MGSNAIEASRLNLSILPFMANAIYPMIILVMASNQETINTKNTHNLNMRNGKPALCDVQSTVEHYLLPVWHQMPVSQLMQGLNVGLFSKGLFLHTETVNTVLTAQIPQR
jgi:hypothetical protein